MVKMKTFQKGMEAPTSFSNDFLQPTDLNRILLCRTPSRPPTDFCLPKDGLLKPLTFRLGQVP